MLTTYSPSISKIGTTCPTPRADRGKDSTLPTREEVLKKLKMLEIDSSFVKEPSRNRDTRPSGRAQSRQVSLRSPRETFSSRRGRRTQSPTCVGFHCGTLRGEIPPACPPPAPKNANAERQRTEGAMLRHQVFPLDTTEPPSETYPGRARAASPRIPTVSQIRGIVHHSLDPVHVSAQRK